MCSAQDIAAASAKLTLGVVWQLMRADVLRFLSTVQVDALVLVYTMCLRTYAPSGGTDLYFFYCAFAGYMHASCKAMLKLLLTAPHMLLLATVQVEEVDIRAWANRKARQQGCAVQLASFRDPTLANGVFILHCLHAVYPHPCFGLRIAIHSNSFPPRCRDPPPGLWPSG